MKKLCSLLIVSILSLFSSASALEVKVLTHGQELWLRTPDSDLENNPKNKMTIATKGGYVGFKANKDWDVLFLHTKLPIASVIFQIDNPADAGTPDSTNLGVFLIHPQYKKSKNYLKGIGNKYGNSEVKIFNHNGWQIYKQESVQISKQGAFQVGTLYTVLDAKKSVADVIVYIRLAWPHLKNNPADYDEDMAATFYEVLASVEGGNGIYQPPLPSLYTGDTSSGR